MSNKKPPDSGLPGDAIFEIRSQIGVMEKNAALREEENFDERTEAIDFVGFHIIDRLEALLQKTGQINELILLKRRAGKIKQDLEAIDVSLFKKIRAGIRSGRCRGTAFKSLVDKYFDSKYTEGGEGAGYDNLDLFVNGLLHPRPMPLPIRDLEPEMVQYQKTPARVVFGLAAKCCFTKSDVFIDLGSGLGQVAILVNLLTGVAARGIEFEPAFCAYARDCARQLNLSDVTFINTDAREAGYTSGTVFFMYTPFKGEMMREVLEILRKESLGRKIKIITYGPCTATAAAQSWLDFAAPKAAGIYKAGFFSSF